MQLFQPLMQSLGPNLVLCEAFNRVFKFLYFKSIISPHFVEMVHARTKGQKIISFPNQIRKETDHTIKLHILPTKI